MKNVLHFSQLRSISAQEAGLPLDSGNGYYSYNYYVLPYSGVVNAANQGNISSILHKKHYSYPFTSFGGIKAVNVKSPTSGEIVYEVTYHHGD